MIIYNAQPVRFIGHLICYHWDIPRRNEDILMKMKDIDPKANTYSLPEFCQKYGTESACEQALFNLKWPKGYKCPKCGFDRKSESVKSEDSYTHGIPEKATQINVERCHPQSNRQHLKFLLWVCQVKCVNFFCFFIGGREDHRFLYLIKR